MPNSVEQDLAAVARIEAVPAILRTIREATGLRVTFIARVLPHRWIACAVHDEAGFGLIAGSELDVSTTLCREVRDTLRPIVIDHASTDPVYCGHPAALLYGFESYINVPIFRGSGEYFGNLCGFDPLPRVVNDAKTLAMMKMFSQLISLQLASEDRHESGRVELSNQREAAELREQFLAVLGHDVRNPLSSIAMGTELLLRKTSDAADHRVLERIRSSTRRIGALVDDLLDLARGQLGGGIRLETSDVVELATRLRHVVAEVQAVHPDRIIELNIDVRGPVRCDVRRVEQLLSNLLANAMEHGAARTPVAVSIGGDDATFRLEVSNAGDPIPDDARGRLFQPYFRGGQSGRRDGLGLGLYIVSEIARAHGGRIEVLSTPERTTFTFTMPRAVAVETAQGPDPGAPSSPSR
jgi:signal transduction histidine kinase